MSRSNHFLDLILFSTTSTTFSLGAEYLEHRFLMRVRVEAYCKSITIGALEPILACVAQLWSLGLRSLAMQFSHISAAGSAEVVASMSIDTDGRPFAIHLSDDWLHLMLFDFGPI